MMKDWNKLTAIQKILRVRGEGLKIEVYDQAEKEFAELEQITAEREAMRRAIVQASIDLTNLITNTPHRSIEDSIVFRSIAGSVVLQVNKDFAAALKGGKG